ncbi:12382_t:CDS:1, partial [Funneliformis mosseae]
SQREESLRRFLKSTVIPNLTEEFMQMNPALMQTEVSSKPKN